MNITLSSFVIKVFRSTVLKSNHYSELDIISYANPNFTLNKTVYQNIMSYHLKIY